MVVFSTLAANLLCNNGGHNVKIKALLPKVNNQVSIISVTVIV